MRYYIVWSSTIPDQFPETAKSSEDDLNHRLYYTTAKDLKTWEDITGKLSMPAKSRHGTMFEVDVEILKKML